MPDILLFYIHRLPQLQPSSFYKGRNQGKSPVKLYLAPLPIAILPPRGCFGNSQVLQLVIPMMGGGGHWHLVGAECGQGCKMSPHAHNFAAQ